VVVGSRPASALEPEQWMSQYVVRHVQTEHGLPAQAIYALAQTPDGYLWIGTEEGAARFDGANFKVFDQSNTPAFSVQYILALSVDREGALWAGTDGGGVLRYRNGSFERLAIDPELERDFVKAIHHDRAGDAWIGTRHNGVFRVHDGKVVARFRAETGLSHDFVQEIIETTDGDHWIATEAGVDVIRGDRVIPYGREHGLPAVEARALVQARDGTVWVGCSDGLFASRRGGAFQRVPDEGKETGGIWSLAEDRHGSLWAGTTGNGVLRVRNGRFVHEPRPAVLATSLAVDILEDREGTVWFGMQGQGIVDLAPSKFASITAAEGVADDMVLSVTGDTSDVWVGTWKGLTRLRGGKMDTFRKSDGLTAEAVMDLRFDRSGVLWIATMGGGVNVMRGGKIGPLGGAHPLSDGGAFTLWEDHAGAMWVGTYSGLNRVRDNDVRAYRVADGLASDQIVATYETREGVLWIGTRDGGVHTFKDEKFARVSAIDDLLHVAADAFYEDVDGALWIGSIGGGLVRYRNGEARLVTTRNGLFNDMIGSLVEDDAGWFWITTNRGIYAVQREELNAVIDGKLSAVHPRVFNQYDGMASTECVTGMRSAWKAPGGRIWFATVKGVTSIDPMHVPTNTMPPSVKIEELDVDRTAATTGEPLAAKSKDFEIHYTALSLTIPERVKFKYRLNGFDNGWVDAGTRRTAYYTNLAPGSYSFQVIACNNDGVWNEKGASVEFRLLPHYYQTIPFFLVVSAITIGAGATAYRVRVRQLKARARELEQRVNERTAELASALGKLETTHATLARVHGDLAEKDTRLHEDLLQAEAFQRGLLPQLPESERLEFGATYVPAEIVGGDIYDVCEVRPHVFRIFIADTTGHGVQASLRTMLIKAEYDRLKSAVEGVGDLLEKLNRNLMAMSGMQVHASACCLDLHIHEGGRASVSYANAAHPEVLRLGAGQPPIYQPGLYLGFDEEATYPQVLTSLFPGEVLVVYSDGAVEEENTTGARFEGKRLVDIASSLQAKSAPMVELVNQVSDAIVDFRGGRPASDDVTLIAVRLLGN
jgi:ligand-binding sensor domain-containing protein/serine phosphatase RsbU (regulator of sigma subunit)